MSLSEQVAKEIIDRASKAISERGRFTWALSGGNSPKTLYRLIAANYRDAIDWSRVHTFWGDERCVGPAHPDSNYRMARETMLDALRLRPETVHRMEGERPDPDQAARDYEGLLRREDVARFDLILLGMGDDGHTASLFPGTTALEEKTRWVAAPWVAKLKTHRITLTFPAINAAACVLFFVVGKDKMRVLENPPKPLPAQRVQPVSGELLWRVADSP
ncbi:MAG: 6-phosphogluconolactonase [Myxococcaceae bacterium]